MKRKRGAANKTDASLAGAQVPWPTAHRAWCRGDAPAALRLGPADAPGQHAPAGALRTAQTPAAWRGVLGVTGPLASVPVRVCARVGVRVLGCARRGPAARVRCG